MKRLPILLCLPALVATAACSSEPDGTTTTDTELQNDTMTPDDGTMMAPDEMPTTNGNGAAGTMGTDGSGTNTDTMGNSMGNTMGSSGTTSGSNTGTSGTGTGTGSTTDTTTGNRTGTTPDGSTPPQ